MKKTFALLLCSIGMAQAATELVYQGSDLGADLLAEEDGQLVSLYLDGNPADSALASLITTPGSMDYTLNFAINADEVHFAVNKALYFNHIISKGTVKSYTIDFGANGSLTAATRTHDQYGGAVQFSQGCSVTLNVQVLAEQLTAGSVYKHVLIDSADKTFDALWNVRDNLTVNAAGLSGYENVGKVTDVSALKLGQYGYVIEGDGGDGAEKGGSDTIALVVAAVPEPAGASLSLLALAGLACRRRRR